MSTATRPDGELRTVARATDALRAALAAMPPKDADNPVQAVRRVAAVARRCRLPTESSWEAFRWAAEKAVRPYFERRDLPAAKAATWAVLDPYFGQLDREEEPGGRPRPTGKRGRTAVAVAGGAR